MIVLIADAAGWGHMGGWGMGMGGWLAMTLTIALIAGIVWAITSRRQGPSDVQSSTAIDLLDRRYAAGEIDLDEYLERKNVIQG